MSLPPERVLLVDDDRNVLSAFKRQFRNQLRVELAASGEDGLQAIKDDGPFAVVISDMQMPNMDGVEFLSRVRVLSSDTVRIMLTGNADLNVATQAINDGNIFRLLSKPVTRMVLYEAINDAVQQYRLLTSERELLNKTLSGTVNLLTDMFGLMAPASYGRSSRIKRYVKAMVQQFDLDGVWSYELAAMLSQLGCVTLPPGLLEKAHSGQPLSETEKTQLQNHPQTGGRLLRHIPRLEQVAMMIELQAAQSEQLNLSADLSEEEKCKLGGQMLKVAIAFDKLQEDDKDELGRNALTELRTDPQTYDPALVEALAAGLLGKVVKVEKLPLELLRPGMVLDQNLLTPSGTLLVAKGQELSPAILQRLRSSEENGVIGGKVQVVSTH